jgi:photosystem II stability/assembly factor-like uncharacterized protein
MSKKFTGYIFIILTFLFGNKIIFAQTNFWEPAPGQIGNKNVRSIAVASNGNVWIGTNEGVYLSTDDGDSWNQKNDTLEMNFVVDIAVSPKNNNHIFVSTIEEGVFMSINNGDNWENKFVFVADQIRILIIPSGEIYLGCLYNFARDDMSMIYYSTNKGDTWTPKIGGLPNNTSIRTLSFDTCNNTLYAGAYYLGSNSGHGVYSSNDGGNNWNSILDNYDIDDLIIADDGAIYVAAQQSMYSVVLKLNREGVWHPVRNEPVANINRELLLFNPKTKHIFYSTVEGVFRTTNSGVDWDKINNGLPISENNWVRSLAVNTKSGRIFLGINGFGVYRSTENVVLDPIIDVHPDRLDFRNVNINTSDTLSVRVTNFGIDNALIVNYSITENSFTILNAGTNYNLPPNGFGDISVEFSPTEARTYNGTLRITHNDPTTVSPINIPLTGRGVVPVPEIYYEPESLDFGEVTVGDEKWIPVTVINKTDADINIKIVGIANQQNDVFVLGPGALVYTIPARDTIYCYIIFRPTEARNYNGFYTLGYEVSGDLLFVPLSGIGVNTGIPVISVEPKQIDFGEVNVGDERRQFVTISNTGNAELELSYNLDTDGSVFSLDQFISKIPAGESIDFYVIFRPTTEKGYTGSLTLTNNINGSSENIIFSGTGVIPRPIILVDTTIDFGEVNVGDSLQKHITITNSGNDTLCISEAFINGDGFIVPWQIPMEILVCESKDFYVTFAPTAEQDYSGTLTLKHNAVDTITTIQLNGKGVTSRVRISIKNYKVKPNETRKVSVDADDLTGRNVKTFSFVLKYNKRILYVKDVYLEGTLSNSLSLSTEDSKPGELVIKVTNNSGTPLTGSGSIVDIDFLGLIGDSCGTHLVLESFEFNSDGPNDILELDNGYCELFGRCGGAETYVTTERTLLYQNNPNPIQEGYQSSIQYRISKAGEIKLTVYDVLGREVAKLVDGYKSEGLYSISFNTKGLPSGVYFYKLRAPGYEGLKKMVIVR